MLASSVIRWSPVPSVVIRLPDFSNRRNLSPARLSTDSTAVATHLVGKTRRSDAVNEVLSHRPRLSSFSSHRSSCLPTSTLMNAPSPASELRCVRARSRVKPHQRVARFLDVCLKRVRCLSVQAIQSQQRLLRGHSTPPLHKTLAKALLNPR